jgi:hypothetical protein
MGQDPGQSRPKGGQVETRAGIVRTLGRTSGDKDWDSQDNGEDQ